MDPAPGKRMDLLEEDSLNVEKRQHECQRKYDKIVSQFDQLMDWMDTVTQLSKRRKNSNRQARKKSASGGGATQSVPAAAIEATLNTQDAEEGASSRTSSPTKTDKTSVLVRTITTHLSALKSVQLSECSSPEP